MTGNGYKQHHDIEPLPNGNILCLLSDIYSNEFIIGQGRNPTYMIEANFRIDKVVELQPMGLNEATLVWEWKMIDHLIQEFDNSAANFGAVSDHPELININYDNGNYQGWSHCNAIDYHPIFDQISLTSRDNNEVFILDHSTNTAEASSHLGGTSNMGGDLLWRWGNPMVYMHGTSNDRKLFGPHDGQWVTQGYQDAGKVSVFNNGGSASNTFSAVHLIQPEYINGTYTSINGVYEPQDFDWSWNGFILGHEMFEGKKSGVQSQPNGNVLICETLKGTISEITKGGTLLWSYRNPVGFTTANQYQEIVEDVDIFRGERYPINYPGLSGHSLSASNPIENFNLNSEACAIVLQVNDPVFKRPICSMIEPRTIRFSTPLEQSEILFYSIIGEVIFRKGSFTGSELQLDVSSGSYVIRIVTNDIIYAQKLVLP